MDTLEKLTINYLRKRPKNLFNTFHHKPSLETNGTAYDILVDRMRKYSAWAISKDLMDSRNTVKAMDTIDFSHTAETPGQADLPAISLDPDTKKMVNECWYLILPPFKKGVLKPNRNRYIVYEILEVNEDDHSYWVSLVDYAYEGVWVLENLAVGMFRWSSDTETPCEYRVAGDKMSAIIERNIKDHASDWTPDDRLYFKEVIIPLYKSVELDQDADLDDLLTHFVGFIMQANVQLVKNKPKAVRGSGNKIKTQAGEVDKNPKPKVVRTLPNGIQIKSVKVPKPMSPDTIRKYHLAAWHSRAHIRHYKDGRITYVKESIHHRKCLQDENKPVIPQTIIKVG